MLAERMRHVDVQHLCCPECKADLVLEGVGEPVADGRLECVRCAAAFPVVRHIARFVPEDNYASGFGLQWTIHSRTQYDEESALPLSEKRFFEETRWPRDLSGQTIIEAGSGSGRFTQHAASTGAMVLSLDYSNAVDANYASNGHLENVLIVQGDIYDMPFREAAADKLFCFGVLQHTPDPERAFLSLPRYLKPGGELVADVYAKSVAKYIRTKYWVRPLTRRIPPERLYRITRRYVDVMWPLARLLRRIPKIGRPLNWQLLIGDYSGSITDDATLLRWAHLDTFDMLSPRYDLPQTIPTVERWCHKAGLENPRVAPGYNGIEISGKRRADP